MIFRCPHCSSEKFKIVGDNVVLCEYCGKESHFSLDEVEHSNTNMSLIQGLKEGYYGKIATLNKEKSHARACLLYYKKLANPKRLVVGFGISIAIAIFSLFLIPTIFVNCSNGFRIAYIICAVLFAVISVSGFLFARMRIKKRRRKYQLYISFYASKVVDCDNEIETCTKQISKLIK